MTRDELERAVEITMELETLEFKLGKYKIATSFSFCYKSFAGDSNKAIDEDGVEEDLLNTFKGEMIHWTEKRMKALETELAAL